jgi:histone-lysine N-methyltransferase SETD3
MPKNRKKKKAAEAVDANSPLFHKNLGNEAFAANDYAKAIESYGRAIEMDPDNHILYSNRSAAYCELETGEGFAAALSDAEACVTKDSAWPKGYFRKGQALKLLKREKEAEAAFADGLTLSPDNKELQEAVVLLAGEMQQAAIMDTQKADGDVFDQLVTWLLGNGSYFPKLYMRQYSENNRGVHCRVNVPQEEELMCIPLKYLITVEMGMGSTVGKKMRAGQLELTASKHCYLAVYLLSDRDNPQSFMQPYYRILPTSYDNIPVFWPQEKLAWLKGSYLQTQIDDRKRNIKNDFDQIRSVAPEFSKYSLEEFTWARMVVASRNFGITINDVKTDALVPYADMLNHYRPRETKWTFNNEKQCFVITALKDLTMGRQVFDSYGKKCNSRFLLNYGFAVEDNRDPDGKCHNEVRLDFRLASGGGDQDPHQQTKLGLLDGASSLRSLRVSMSCDSKNTREAISFLRFVHATGKELMVLPSMGMGYDIGENPIRPISCENEIKV